MTPPQLTHHPQADGLSSPERGNFFGHPDYRDDSVSSGFAVSQIKGCPESSNVVDGIVPERPAVTELDLAGPPTVVDVDPTSPPPFSMVQSSRVNEKPAFDQDIAAYILPVPDSQEELTVMVDPCKASGTFTNPYFVNMLEKMGFEVEVSTPAVFLDREHPEAGVFLPDYRDEDTERQFAEAAIGRQGEDNTLFFLHGWTKFDIKGEAVDIVDPTTSKIIEALVASEVEIQKGAEVFVDDFSHHRPQHVRIADPEGHTLAEEMTRKHDTADLMEAITMERNSLPNRIRRAGAYIVSRLKTPSLNIQRPASV